MRRALAVLVLAIPFLFTGQVQIYVDEQGHTTLSDRAPSEGRIVESLEAREALWDDGVAGPPLITPPGSSGSEDDQLARLLRGALDDLRRGDRSRASRALDSVLETDPDRPEAHWYLALLDGRRGRFESAEAHLHAFLDSAGPEFATWRASAERRLAQIADERRLMDSDSASSLRLVDLAHPDFTIQADAELLEAGSTGFARTVAGYLDDARAHQAESLGAVTAEPTGVVLYGRPAYRRTHGHRFGFSTVGFFDGRIHAVSAAHPAGELRALLFHEYTHALFRERVGSDRPFWLNEGLAEIAERAAEGRQGLSRVERNRLRAALDDGRWLSLRRLQAGFGGLDTERARLAYAASTAAALHLMERGSPDRWSRLLDALGAGASPDEALEQTFGLDTDAIDRALRARYGDTGQSAALAR